MFVEVGYGDNAMVRDGTTELVARRSYEDGGSCWKRN